MILRQGVDQGSDNPGSNTLDDAQPQIAGGRVRDEIDIADALSKLIEHGVSALHKCGTVDGWFNAVT